MYIPALFHTIAIFLLIGTPATAGNNLVSHNSTSPASPSCFVANNECPLLSNGYNNAVDKLSITANDYKRATFYCNHAGADLHVHGPPHTPHPLDCYKAARLMPTDPDEADILFSYLPDDDDDEGYHVPNEWSHGSCTIMLDLIPDFADGKATWERLYLETLQLLKTCVMKSPTAEAGGKVIVGYGTGLQVAVHKREVGRWAQDCRIL